MTKEVSSESMKPSHWLDCFRVEKVCVLQFGSCGANCKFVSPLELKGGAQQQWRSRCRGLSSIEVQNVIPPQRLSWSIHLKSFEGYREELKVNLIWEGQGQVWKSVENESAQKQRRNSRSTYTCLSRRASLGCDFECRRSESNRSTVVQQIEPGLWCRLGGRDGEGGRRLRADAMSGGKFPKPWLSTFDGHLRRWRGVSGDTVFMRIVCQWPCILTRTRSRRNPATGRWKLGREQDPALHK